MAEVLWSMQRMWPEAFDTTVAFRAAERRKKVAHGASRKIQGTSFNNKPRRGERADDVRSVAPPGLHSIALIANPRLTPWATFCRRSAAKKAERDHRADATAIASDAVLANPSIDNP